MHQRKLTMTTFTRFDLAFVVGGQAAAAPAAPTFASQIGGDVVGAAEGCAAGATKGIFGGPHAALFGCAFGAGASALSDIVQAAPDISNDLSSIFNKPATVGPVKKK